TEIVLTMANMDDNESDAVPNIDMELVTTEGLSVTVPLNDVMPFSPVIETNYTPFGSMDKIFQEGKYEENWEPIFQTFSIPLERFEQKHSDFTKQDIQQ